MLSSGGGAFAGSASAFAPLSPDIVLGFQRSPLTFSGPERTRMQKETSQVEGSKSELDGCVMFSVPSLETYSVVIVSQG
jgi:hypothetical protein